MENSIERLLVRKVRARGEVHKKIFQDRKKIVGCKREGGGTLGDIMTYQKDIKPRGKNEWHLNKTKERKHR